MLRPRITPCLLIKDRGLVKTVNFTAPKYVGDPLNAVRIFNEKEVDELIVLDIDASPHGKEPDYAAIERLAAECRMPLCYGGGIGNVEQAVRICSLGVEKIALSTAIVNRPELISDVANRLGRQSVVAVLDVKSAGSAGKYEIVVANGKRRTGLDPVRFAARLQSLGVGEVVVNSVDRDGTMKGYDLELIRQLRSAVSVPITALGGAGKLEDIGGLIREFGWIGAAAGSLFVFKGVFRAVLINYPSMADKEALVKVNLQPKAALLG